MSNLPIIDVVTAKGNSTRRRLATLLRCGMVILLALAVRLTVERQEVSQTVSRGAVPIADVQTISATTKRLTDPDAEGFQQGRDSDGRLVTVICQSQPAAASIVGYRGTSNVLLVLDTDSRVTALSLLDSADTLEHVDAIRRDAGFFRQFEGWTLGDPSSFTAVDATSGATLTSLAIAEGVALRLGGEKRSLRFPDRLTETECRELLEMEAAIQLAGINNYETEVNDKDGRIIGSIIRTGPLADSTPGYQGPSELIVFCDSDNVIAKVRLGKTYENQPYARYLNEEDYFWRVFEGKSFVNLRHLNIEEEQVEGVSGATMTSMAVAETMVAAASECYRRQEWQQARQYEQQVHWTGHDTGTAAILFFAVVVGSTRLRGIRWIQVSWQLLLIGYFGLVTGNLISLAVVMGGASSGIAWRLAPGLCAVIIVGLIAPPLSKRNLYCTHICPHGAVQQMLRRLPVRPWRPGKKLLRLMRYIPGVILVAAVVVTLSGEDGSLAAWEPFNAWIWYVAGPFSLCVAAVSLLVSAFLPMGWCRYGCGTGRLLEYLRHSARADRVMLADGLLFVLLCAAWGRALIG